MTHKILLSMSAVSILIGTGLYANENHNKGQNAHFQKGKKMNKNIRNGLIVVSTSMLMSGCGSTDGNGNSAATGNSELPTAVQSAIDAPITALSQELTNTLSYMGNEERLAYDVYNKLYDEWGTKQFTNIASKSEVKHISAVQELVKKYKLNDNVNFTNVDLPALGYMNTAIGSMEAGTYDISKIQRLYDDLVARGSTSEVDALKVGCIIEVVDVNDLDEYITLAEQSNASDVVDVFNFLRDGSYNHYWAFDKGLKNKGVAEGCCAIGTIDGVNYCHPEYPNNDKGGKGKN